MSTNHSHLLLVSLGHLGDPVQFLDLLEKLERLVPGASEAPAHDCASDPGQAEDYFFVMIFCNYRVSHKKFYFVWEGRNNNV